MDFYRLALDDLEHGKFSSSIRIFTDVNLRKYDEGSMREVKYFSNKFLEFVKDIFENKRPEHKTQMAELIRCLDLCLKASIVVYSDGLQGFVSTLGGFIKPLTANTDQLRKFASMVHTTLFVNLMPSSHPENMKNFEKLIYNSLLSQAMKQASNAKSSPEYIRSLDTFRDSLKFCMLHVHRSEAIKKVCAGLKYIEGYIRNENTKDEILRLYEELIMDFELDFKSARTQYYKLIFSYLNFFIKYRPDSKPDFLHSVQSNLQGYGAADKLVWCLIELSLLFRDIEGTNFKKKFAQISQRFSQLGGLQEVKGLGSVGEDCLQFVNTVFCGLTRLLVKIKDDLLVSPEEVDLVLGLLGCYSEQLKSTGFTTDEQSRISLTNGCRAFYFMVEVLSRCVNKAEQSNQLDSRNGLLMVKLHKTLKGSMRFIRSTLHRYPDISGDFRIKLVGSLMRINSVLVRRNFHADLADSWDLMCKNVSDWCVRLDSKVDMEMADTVFASKCFSYAAQAYQKKGDFKKALSLVVNGVLFTPKLQYGTMLNIWASIKKDCAREPDPDSTLNDITVLELFSEFETIDLSHVDKTALFISEFSALRDIKIHISKESMKIANQMLQAVNRTQLTKGRAYLIMTELLYYKNFDIDMRGVDCADHAIECLNYALSQSQRSNQDSACIGDLLATAYFWQYSFNLYNMRNYVEAEVEALLAKPVDKKHAIPGEEIDPNEGGAAISIYAHISIDKELKMLIPLVKAIKMWSCVLEMVETDREAYADLLIPKTLARTLDLIRTAAEHFAMAKQLKEEIRSWFLIRGFCDVDLSSPSASTQQSLAAISNSYAMATFRIARCLCGVGLVSQAATLLDSPHFKDSYRRSTYALTLESMTKAEVYLHSNQVLEGWDLLCALWNTDYGRIDPVTPYSKSDVDVQLNLYDLLIRYKCMPNAILPFLAKSKIDGAVLDLAEEAVNRWLGLDKSLRNKVALNQGKPDSKDIILWYQSSVSFNMLSSTRQIGTLYSTIGASREARQYLRYSLLHSQKMGAAHQVACLELALCKQDVLCAFHQDAKLKLQSVEHILRNTQSTLDLSRFSASDLPPKPLVVNQPANQIRHVARSSQSDNSDSETENVLKCAILNQDGFSDDEVDPDDDYIDQLITGVTKMSLCDGKCMCLKCTDLDFLCLAVDKQLTEFDVLLSQDKKISILLELENYLSIIDQLISKKMRANLVSLTTGVPNEIIPLNCTALQLSGICLYLEHSKVDFDTVVELVKMGTCLLEQALDSLLVFDYQLVAKFFFHSAVVRLLQQMDEERVACPLTALTCTLKKLPPMVQKPPMNEGTPVGTPKRERAVLEERVTRKAKLVNAPSKAEKTNLIQGIKKGRRKPLAVASHKEPDPEVVDHLVGASDRTSKSTSSSNPGERKKLKTKSCPSLKPVKKYESIDFSSDDEENVFIDADSNMSADLFPHLQEPNPIPKRKESRTKKKSSTTESTTPVTNRKGDVDLGLRRTARKPSKTPIYIDSSPELNCAYSSSPDVSFCSDWLKLDATAVSIDLDNSLSSPIEESRGPRPKVSSNSKASVGPAKENFSPVGLSLNFVQTEFNASPVKPCSEALELFEKSMRLVMHMPDSVIFPRLCLYQAVLSIRESPMRAAYLLSESTAVSLRHIFGVTKKRILSKMALNKELSAEDMMKHTQQLETRSACIVHPGFLEVDGTTLDWISDLPKDWTVCVVGLVPDNLHPGFKKPLNNNLVITRFRNGEEPLVINTSTDPLVVKEFDSEFNRLMEAATMSLKLTEQKEWWRCRSDIDKQLQNYLKAIEDRWLGAFKGVFLGHIVNTEERKSLADFTDGILAAALELGLSFDGFRQLMQVLVDSRNYLDDEMVLKGLQYMTGLSTSDQRLIDLKNKFPPSNKQQETNGIGSSKEAGIGKIKLKETSRHLTVIILDKSLISLPWESMPILRSHQVTRMPSVHFLRAHLAVYEDKPFVNSESTFYVLNPGTDLKFTQQCFQGDFQSRGWNGVSGTKPTKNEWKDGIEKYNLFIYAGHGSGSEYISKEDIALLDARSTNLLMGCSSAKIKNTTSFLEGNGTIYQYVIAGSPCMVGNLWDVTDRDIDKYLKEVINLWIDNRKKNKTAIIDLNLSQVVTKAREACKLKYLTAAAPVTYGLPSIIKS